MKKSLCKTTAELADKVMIKTKGRPRFPGSKRAPIDLKPETWEKLEVLTECVNKQCQYTLTANQVTALIVDQELNRIEKIMKSLKTYPKNKLNNE